MNKLFGDGGSAYVGGGGGGCMEGSDLIPWYYGA